MRWTRSMRWELSILGILLILLAGCQQEASTARILQYEKGGIFTLPTLQLEKPTLDKESVLLITNTLSIPLTDVELAFTGYDPNILSLKDFQKTLQRLEPEEFREITGNAHITMPKTSMAFPLTIQAYACMRIQPKSMLTISKDGVTSMTQPEGPVQIMDARVSGNTVLLTLVNTGSGLVYSQFTLRDGSCLLPSAGWLGRIDVRKKDGLGLSMGSEQAVCKQESWLGSTLTEQKQGRIRVKCTFPSLPDTPTTAMFTFAYRYREPLFTHTIQLIPPDTSGQAS